MKELLPYFRLLKEVRWQFAASLLCALIYGLSSGFGLPFMTSVVFPKIFSSNNQGVQLYTELQNGDFHPLKVISEAQGNDFFVEDGSEFKTIKGVSVQGQGFSVQLDQQLVKTNEQLYVEEKGAFLKVKGGLYSHDSTTDRFIPIQNEQNLSSQWELFGYILLLPIVFFTRGLSSYLNIYFINHCGLYVLERIRLMVFDKLQNLSLSFFNRHKSGDLLNRLLGDTTTLQSALMLIANDMLKQPVTLVGGVGYIVYQSIQKQETAFILLSFLIIGVCVLPIRFIGKRIIKRVFQMQEQLGSVAAIANENISAHREVLAFNLQQRERSRFMVAAKRFFKLQLKVIRYESGLTPIIEVITATGLSFAIFYASQKGMTLSDILPLIMALYMSYEPIKKIGSMNSKLKTAQAALKRLDYVMHQKDDTPDAEKAQLFPASIDRISMENLDFAYEDETVLKLKQLHINKEEIVALVGPSGAGKSTFAALLPRFYDPQQGQICFNGVDLKALNKNDLRARISIVSQDTVLFDDSVMGNIRLGQPDASDEDVMRAAQVAQAHGFIEGLPNGYDTIIGERGTRLSGGQKQRLAIARAFLKDAPILILDEATSALDSESEAKIQQALEELVVGKTVFIIAHRFSTIKLAHRILVFEKGEIVADGSHEELIVESGLYRELHERQELG